MSPADDIARKIVEEPRELTEETARRLLDALDQRGAFAPVRRIRNSQVASAALGAVGAALLFVGVENAASDIPFISNPYGSIFVGGLLLAATGTLLARFGQPRLTTSGSAPRALPRTWRYSHRRAAGTMGA